MTSTAHGTPTTPLRVLELAGSAAGGVRAHLADCARLLSAGGHDVVVAAPAAVTDGADLGGARVREMDIGPRPSLEDAVLVSRIGRLARRVDAVHAHGLRAGALAALALGPRRRRLVVSVHNRPVGGWLTTAIGARLEALVAARADVVLAVSPDLAESVRRRGARDVEIAVIPAPSHLGQATAPVASSIESAWHGADLKLLTVARLAPQKGLDMLLDAAALLSERLPGSRGRLVWAVAGAGPLEAALAGRIASQGLPVRLLGHREDVAVLLSAADVVVQTSQWEGQPLTIQEALRAGAAVVATDVGGTAVTAGGAAVLVEPSAQALAQAVHRLLTDAGALDEARQASRRAAASLPGEQALASQLERVLRGTGA
ncbi:glycosyltransferase [Actinomyces sp. W5033]|uniref:glycosyltransferase n=1 Tax=Actinomyces sp. W5033 TaxID=3446479 RepID=UPI003EE40D54